MANIFDTLLAGDPDEQRRKFRFFNSIPGAEDTVTQSQNQPATALGERPRPKPTAGEEQPQSPQEKMLGMVLQSLLPAARGNEPNPVGQAIAQIAARGPGGGRHLGMGGEEITPQNPMGDTFGTLQWKGEQFHPTREAALASQGPSAMNQWAQRGGVQGVNADLLAKLMTPNEPVGRVIGREQAPAVAAPPPAPTPTDEDRRRKTRRNLLEFWHKLGQNYGA